MKYAVIGGGLAGIKIASLLGEAGHEVTVFEKSRGLGGRLANRRTDWGALDIGAQYFTVRDDGFHNDVLRWEQAGVVQVWDFSPWQVRQGVLQPSPDDTVRYIGTPLMNAPVYALARELPVHYQCTVVNVTRDAQRWRLDTREGESHDGFDWLIVTSPAEQSRALLDHCTDLLAGIPAAIHRSCWALGLATRGEVAADIQGIFGDDTVRWVSRLSSRPGFHHGPDIDDVWMLHFAPQWSEQQGKETTLDIGQVGVDWLQSITGRTLERVAEHRHFWRYANIKSVSFNQPYLIDAGQQLAVAGAWCAGGRVEGAWLSAVRLAQVLAGRTTMNS